MNLFVERYLALIVFVLLFHYFITLSCISKLDGWTVEAYSSDQFLQILVDCENPILFIMKGIKRLKLSKTKTTGFDLFIPTPY